MVSLKGLQISLTKTGRGSGPAPPRAAGGVRGGAASPSAPEGKIAIFGPGHWFPDLWSRFQGGNFTLNPNLRPTILISEFQRGKFRKSENYNIKLIPLYSPYIPFFFVWGGSLLTGGVCYSVLAGLDPVCLGHICLDLSVQLFVCICLPGPCLLKGLCSPFKGTIQSL